MKKIKIGALCAAACAIALPISFALAADAPTRLPDPTACAPRALGDATWDGYTRIRGSKGYAQTPMGQVHYRLMGPDNGPVLVLIHQTPWSMVQYADVQPCMAMMGYRTLAIDTPGYGMSDVPTHVPTIGEYADNIIPVLDALKINKVSIAGHHTGAAVAAAFANRHADRIERVILHGAPNYNDAERIQRKSLPHPQLALRADGSHLSEYFAKLHKSYGRSPRHLATVNWSTINIFLAGPGDTAHEIVFDHDMASDLKGIEVPLLVLSDAQDALHEIDQRTGQMKSNFRFQKFSDSTPHAMMLEPKRWAETVVQFLRTTH